MIPLPMNGSFIVELCGESLLINSRMKSFWSEYVSATDSVGRNAKFGWKRLGIEYAPDVNAAGPPFFDEYGVSAGEDLA